MPDLDALDRNLLNLVQTDFPLKSRPYEALGLALGRKETEVISRLERLRQDRVLRQISAIFDSRALGYSSALVAAERSSGRREEAAALVSAHPGVSHNYQREHRLDLWFTLAVPADRDIDEEADRLANEAGFVRHHVLPSLRSFRVGVAFDMESGKARGLKREEGGASAKAPQTRGAIQPNGRDQSLVRALQEDLALEERPFLRLADGLGIPEGSVFAWMEAARDLGWMRRFAAVLRHREAGFGEGGMGVWAAPEPSLEGLGQAFATEAAVTHCYQRPVFEGWPYGLFTMVHGRDRRDCEAMLDAMAGRHHGWTARAVLYSTHEYKKERVKYFLEEQGPRHLPVEAQERPC